LTYQRVPYLDPSVKTEQSLVAFGSAPVEVPVFDLPVSPLENFKRVAARSDPLWVPCAICDFQTMMAQDPAPINADGLLVHTNFRDPRNKQNYDFTDWFYTEWTWVASAGGAMLKPGTQLIRDITRWEKELIWPDFSKWDFAAVAEDFMKNKYNPQKVLHYDIGRGLTERLISFLGGYTEGMLALAAEPEAVIDLLNRYADFVISYFDMIFALYPLNMVTYHDDWGTEKDTFFSEKMMEEIVFEPTKRIIDHIRGKGVAFEFHSCGNVTRFMPYFIGLGADFTQLQRRAVNLPLMKQKYGDKIGFNTGIEGLAFGAKISKDERALLIRNTVDIYAEGGGVYLSLFSADAQDLWESIAELYAYSREYYDMAREKIS